MAISLTGCGTEATTTTSATTDTTNSTEASQTQVTGKVSSISNGTVTLALGEVDENALRIDNATVTLDGITVDKSAGATSSTENGDFYGVNAALLATMVQRSPSKMQL